MNNGINISEVLQEYLAKDETNLTKLVKELVSVKNQDAEFLPEEIKEQGRNTKKEVEKWRNGTNGIGKANICNLKQAFKNLNDDKMYKRLEYLEERGSFAWDVSIKDKKEHPEKYEDCLKSKPPFLTDAEFNELNSLYPNKKVFEEILTLSPSEFSKETEKFVEKMNRYIKGQEYYTSKDGIEFWKNMYHYFEYTTGRLLGDSILDAPFSVAEILINIYLRYYNGNSIATCMNAPLKAIGRSLKTLNSEKEYNYKHHKYVISVGKIRKYHDERTSSLADTYPKKDITLTEIALGIDIGKTGNIIKKCYEEIIENKETTYTINNFADVFFMSKPKYEKRQSICEVLVAPNDTAKEYYEWFMDNIPKIHYRSCGINEGNYII